MPTPLTGDIQVSTVGVPTKCTFSSAGADTFYRGSIVYADTAGGVQTVPEAGDRAVGISVKKQVTTGAGQEVEVYTEGLFWVPIGTDVAAADEGDFLMIDADVDLCDNFALTYSAADCATGVAENDIVIGQILRVKTSTMLIAIEPGITTGRLVPATVTNMKI